jgi:cytoskeleton protein RodZ
MNDDNVIADNNVDPRQLVAGQMLAQQREQLGLELGECAETLKISVAKVIALESGDDTPFASEIFIRGYLKNYAKLLNLSGCEIISCYDSQKQGDQAHKNRAIEQAAQTSSKWWLPYLVGVVVVCGWFFVSNYLELQDKLISTVEQEKILLKIAVPLNSTLKSNGVGERLTTYSNEINNPPQSLGEEFKQDKIENKQSIGTSDVDSGNVSLNIGKEILSEPAIIVAEPVKVKGVMIDTEGAALLVDEQVANIDVLNLPPQEPLTNVSADVFSVDDSLYFTFVDACWVEIVDASDETIMSSLRKANSDLLVQGKAPFFIILGNISGTTLRFNDEKIALDGSRDGRTLRLTVGG